MNVTDAKKIRTGRTMQIVRAMSDGDHYGMDSSVVGCTGEVVGRGDNDTFILSMNDWKFPAEFFVPYEMVEPIRKARNRAAQS